LFWFYLIFKRVGFILLSVSRSLVHIIAVSIERPFSLQGHVGMFARNVGQILGGQDLEVVADNLASIRWVNDIINETSLRGYHGVGKACSVFHRMLNGVLASVQDFDGTLGTHDGNFSIRPRVVGITTQVLAGHDIVRTTVGLANNDSDLGDIGLSVGEQELGTMANDTAMFLTSSEVDLYKEGHVSFNDNTNNLRYNTSEYLPW
jgi:hypothetical protein